MKFLLWLVGVILLLAVVPILLFVCLVVATDQRAEPKDYVQLAGVSLAFLAGAASTVFASRTARQQRESAEALEELKSRLAQIAPREHEAYNAMWAAIAIYYRALSDLEVGELNFKALGEAGDSCKRAESLSLFVEEAHLNEFYRYWQNATRIEEDALDQKSNPEALKAIWRREMKPLSQLRNTMQKDFASKLLHKV